MSYSHSAIAPPERLYHIILAPTENVEDYRPGKLHPVHLGDSFKSGRYVILRKLGYGADSTVWLAKDKDDYSLNRYVALKILTADASSRGTERAIIEYLSREGSLHARQRGKSKVMTLLDEFTHKGPNGTHVCLVLEPMGPSVATMVERLPQNIPQQFGRRYRYPAWMAKSILRQVLLGLHYLHNCPDHVVHGDLQPGNLLFSLKDLSSVGEAQLWQSESRNQISKPVRRLDGKDDAGAPRYLTMNQPLDEFTDITPNFQIKISDLGAAFLEDKPPGNFVTPLGLRSPELILLNRINRAQDIWSFGCLIFEFLTGRPLFTVDTVMSNIEEADDDHLLQMIDILGPLPKSLAERWPRWRTYFDESGVRIKDYIGEPFDQDKFDAEMNDNDDHTDEQYDDDDFYPDDSIAEVDENNSVSEVVPTGSPMPSEGSGPILPPLEQFFDLQKPSSLDVAESQVIVTLLKQILDYDPARRPSTSELLEHPWFATPPSHDGPSM